MLKFAGQNMPSIKNSAVGLNQLIEEKNFQAIYSFKRNKQKKQLRPNCITIILLVSTDLGNGKLTEIDSDYDELKNEPLFPNLAYWQHMHRQSIFLVLINQSDNLRIIL